MKKVVLRKAARQLSLLLCGMVMFGAFTVTASSGTPLTNQSLSEVKISTDKSELSLREAFELIQSQTDFRFYFDSEKVSLSQEVKMSSGDLKGLLQEFADDLNLKFERVSGRIAVTDGKGEVVEANYQDRTISGTVVDQDGNPMPIASVFVQGTQIGTQTNAQGEFRFGIPNNADTLVASFVGYITKKVAIGNRSIFQIVLNEDVSQLDEVVVVGFGTQKKEAVVGAMSSVKPAELKIPSSNLTTALAGRVAGVVSYQTSGEPGADNAQFFVRGVASFNGQNGPLILIDGVELTADDLARLQPDDIESFSVLKDPTTTAIYGARGANGIILVTTKSGQEGTTRINLRIETALSEPVSLVELADPLTYMRLQNEAFRTRGEVATFTEEQIAGTERGGNPNIYPATDWRETLFRDFAPTTRVNLNVTGGSRKVRYYVAGSFTQDNGLLKTDSQNPFTNGIDLKRYLLRSNINIDLTNSTEMIVRLHSTIDDYRGPIQGGNAIFAGSVRTSPVRFRPFYDPDPSLVGVPHIIFGNGTPPREAGGFTGGDNQINPVWFNPYAELQRGFRDNRRQLSLVQLEFKQDLGSILPGLSARFLGNANTTSFFESIRSYLPFYYRVLSFDAFTEDYTLTRASTNGDESLRFTQGPTINNSVLYMETAVNYANTFNEKHNVTGLLVLTGREFLDGNAPNVQLSLPSRNITLAGRYNYDYDNRYFAEFNFGYNGSERFAEDNRFGFFPSFGAGWLVSSEPFFSGLSNTFSRLKLRASYGWVGNDQIGNTRQDRFFYLSEVDINAGGAGATFGREFNRGIGGVRITRYANQEVTWEVARKLNLGLEVNLFNDALQFRVDAFHEHRSSILQNREDIPSTLGLQAPLQTNVGEVESRGLDASLDINHSFSDDLWIQGRATFTYADNEFKVFEEPDFAANGTPWRTSVGLNVNQPFGYIAERLFADDEEAMNSPRQFGTPGEDYGGGDIKYKDLNGDGEITSEDLAPIGKPQFVPKINYGFGFSAGYKKLDFSVFFQGSAESSFFINPSATAPFNVTQVGNVGVNTVGNGNGIWLENGLLKAYADSHWSEENRDLYALYPRLSPTAVQNNNQQSTWWLRDGTFLRLKQLEVGYNVFNGQENKLGISKLRVYVSGTNLAIWSKFKQWDAELAGNALNYPLQRVYNFGVQVGF